MLNSFRALIWRQLNKALIVSTGFHMHIHRVNPAIVWLPYWVVHLTTFDGC
jgi:hypothetical protein